MISILVGTSAATGMIIQYRRYITVVHVFVFVTVIGILSTLTIDAFAGGGITGLGFLFSTASGFIYGLLPTLVKSSSRGDATCDIGSVGIYLAYGAVFATVFDLISTGGEIYPFAISLANPDTIIAGVICTGLGYSLFQVGVTSDCYGRSIGSAWASLMFGAEPVTAILVAALFMGQSFTLLSAALTGLFVFLATMSGLVLNQIPTPRT